VRRDYVTTFIAEALVLASALAVYRLIALGYGTTGFGEYSVTRRTLTLLLPFGVIGLDVGIARLAAYAAESRPREARSFLVAALPIAGVGVALTAILLWLFPAFFAQVFFGDPGRAPLVGTLPVLLAGATGHVLVYGNLRGRGRIAHANVLMVANHAVIPLATLLIGGPLTQILLALGGAWLVCSAVAFLLTDKDTHEVRRLSGELLRFGGRRVPGDLVQLLFFALPVIITAQIAGVVDAGIVAFGITALGMIGSSLTPIGFVLLPFASRLMGRGAVQDLRVHVLDILRVVTPLVILGVILVEILAEEIVRRYLGPDFAPAADVLRLVLLGAIPWSAFVVLRSIVDARYERAVNARNLLIAFVVFVVAALPAALLAESITAVLAAFVGGLYVLGALTLFESFNALRTGRDVAPEVDVRLEA
jgi:O-antigen/teichoic acid export membrane protein